ncbi:MAG: ferredoxin family protein [Chloroflexi bacterium]|nr:ferredoxin family protein [Chloroflexota bacterium]
MRTKYIELNTRRCQACWKCIEACPNHVLGRVVVFKHRHARVDRAEACKGCKACVRSCPNEAIRYTYLQQSSPVHYDGFPSEELNRYPQHNYVY